MLLGHRLLGVVGPSIDCHSHTRSGIGDHTMASICNLGRIMEHFRASLLVMCDVSIIDQNSTGFSCAAVPHSLYRTLATQEIHLGIVQCRLKHIVHYCCLCPSCTPWIKEIGRAHV